jgi:hypothetical protein
LQNQHDRAKKQSQCLRQLQQGRAKLFFGDCRQGSVRRARGSWRGDGSGSARQRY